MMHQDIEVYVDDMIMKSQDRLDHLAALERFFEMIKQLRLKLDPKKCTFGVTSGKLLGYMVSERGIETDPDKIRDILDMLGLRTKKEISGFLGRLQYISRFIAKLIDTVSPFFNSRGRVNLLFWMISANVHLRGSGSTCCRLQSWCLLHQVVSYSYTCQSQT